MGLDEPLAVAGPGRAAHGSGPAARSCPAPGACSNSPGQPGRVAHVGLAAGQELDVAGARPAAAQSPAPPTPTRPASSCWPVASITTRVTPSQASQAANAWEPRGEGLKRPHLLDTATAPIGGAHARHHLVGGDIQPGAARHQQLHVDTSPARGWVPGRADRTGDAHNACSQQQFVVPGRPPRQWYQRALSHQGKPSLAGHARFSSLAAAPGHASLISNRPGTAVRKRVSPGRCRP
jgi:hypothetical protein